MKKLKLTSLLLAIAMLVSMIPYSAFAQEEEVAVQTPVIAADEDTTAPKLPVEGDLSKEKKEEATEYISKIMKLLDLSHVGDKLEVSYTLPFFGKKITLLNLDTKINVPIGNNKDLPIEILIDEKNKVIKVGSGFNSATNGFSVVDSGDTESPQITQIDPNSEAAKDFTKKANLAKSIQSDIEENQTEDAKNVEKRESLFDKWKKSIESTQMKYICDVDANAGAYLEFSYTSGELVFSSGVAVVGIRTSLPEMNYKLPGVLYIGTKISMGMDGAIGIDKDSVLTSGSLKYRGALNSVLEVSTKSSVGIGSLAYIEGGIESGKLTTKFDSNAEPKLQAYLSSKILLRLSIMGYSWTQSWDIPNAQVFPRTGDASILADKSFEDFMNEATPIDRSYLNNGDAGISGSSKYLFEKNSTYPISSPSLVSLDDGRMLLVWLDDTGEKSDANSRSIMYSICDTKGTWSAPKVLFEDGCDFDSPELHTEADGNIYLTYGKANGKMVDNLNAFEKLKNYDLYIAKFNGTGFDTPVCIDSLDGRTAVITSVSVDEEGYLTVAWAENEKNNVFLNEGTNKIFVRKAIDDEWETVDNIGSPGDSWSKETERFSSTSPMIDFETTNDGALYYSEIYGFENGNMVYALRRHTSSESKEFLYSSENEIKNLQADGSNIYFIDGDEIKLFDGKKVKSTGITGVSDYKVKDAVILINVGDMFETELYISQYKDGMWNEPAMFTDMGKYIRSYSLAVCKDGSVKVAVNALDLKRDDLKYENANLIVTEQCDFFDIGVDDLDFQDGEETPGTVETLEFNVYNHGVKNSTSFKAKIVDQNNNVLAEKDYSCNIKPNGSGKFEIAYSLPANPVNTELHLEIITDENDVDLSNNKTKLVIGAADLEIQNLRILEKEGKVACTIANVGGAPAEGVTVILKNDISKALVCVENLQTIPAGESRDILVDLPGYMLTAKEGTLNAIDVEVKTSSIENNLLKNFSRYVFGTLTNLANGWKLEGGNWKYYKDGKAQIGWIFDGNKWYYINTAGSLAKGWHYVAWSGGVDWFCFDQDGAMYRNTTTPDGYKVDDDGAWEIL